MMYVYTHEWTGPPGGLGLGQGPGPELLPTVTEVTFKNHGSTHPDNCFSLRPPPRRLGVGVDYGDGPTASNAMELQFTISGHRPGIWYDILRTMRSSLWERKTNRDWNRLDFKASGTFDDHKQYDECLEPRNNKIFVVDTPGWDQVVLPAPLATRFTSSRGGPTTTGDRDTTDVVLRNSFAEWVNVKSRNEGIEWTTIYKYVHWYNIIWLVRDAGNPNLWVLGPRSKIAKGSLSEAVIESAPSP